MEEALHHITGLSGSKENLDVSTAIMSGTFLDIKMLLADGFLAGCVWTCVTAQKLNNTLNGLEDALKNCANSDRDGMPILLFVVNSLDIKEHSLGMVHLL